MPICEKCGNPHDGSYGSGRFCSVACKNSHTSLIKREETNQKVSATMQRLYAEGIIVIPTQTPEYVEKATAAIRKRARRIFDETSWESLTRAGKIKRVLEEQEGRCQRCGINDWMETPIRFELHHLDGNSKNNSRENCVLYCPNCHSQTPNFRGKNKGSRNRNQISDEELLETVRKSKNIRQLLLSLGLSAKGANYESIRKRLESLGVRLINPRKTAEPPMANGEPPDF